MANDRNDVRYEPDRTANLHEIFNSPWYSDAEYPRFSDAEHQRRRAAACELMQRDGLDCRIPREPDIYSLGAV